MLTPYGIKVENMAPNQQTAAYAHTHSLGAGNARGAELVFRVAAVVTLTIASLAGAATYALRRPLIAAFTGEANVLALGLSVMPIVALSLLGE